MGEMAEYMLNGDDCQECGAYIGGGGGFPRSCAGCQPSKSQQKRFTAQRANEPSFLKMNCPECGARVKRVGINDHMRDKHGATP